MQKQALAFGVIALGTLLAGAASAGGKLSGAIRVDGSSTVFPITEAVAEEFRGPAPGVKLTVGISGTGGGFKKFCAGETDINDASRPIDPKEVALCAEKGIGFIELPIAFDGLTVVVNPKNTFVDKLTVAELRLIWKPDSPVKRWKDVRSEWPDEPISLYGPGHDSGTFDYFTEVVNGKAKACRADYTASEDDNVLVQGVVGDPHALGFFGYSYYLANQKRLKGVPIDGGQGPVAPSMETIRTGTYSPLSRPLFLYVARSAADRAEVDAFVTFYLRHLTELVEQVGYVALPKEIDDLVAQRYAKRVTGTVFGEGHGGRSIEDLLKAERT